MKQVMIVTGASRIGAAVAARTRGYAVCVNYKSRADRAQAVVDAIRGQGGTAVAVARMCRPKPASWPCSAPRTASWDRSPRW